MLLLEYSCLLTLWFCVHKCLDPLFHLATHQQGVLTGTRSFQSATVCYFHCLGVTAQCCFQFQEEINQALHVLRPQNLIWLLKSELPRYLHSKPVYRSKGGIMLIGEKKWYKVFCGSRISYGKSGRLLQRMWCFSWHWFWLKNKNEIKVKKHELTRPVTCSSSILEGQGYLSVCCFLAVTFPD